jgi:hypothetical protein
MRKKKKKNRKNYYLDNSDYFDYFTYYTSINVSSEDITLIAEEIFGGRYYLSAKDLVGD